MKAASSCARARKLLASVAATLAATLTLSMPSARADDQPANPPDSGYPKIGTSGESMPGYRLNVKKIEDGKPQSNQVVPHLFTVHTEKGVIKAYCIEIEVDIIYDSSLRIGGWKDFPGTNKFKDNPDVQTKVAWIAQNSYPQTDLAKVIETTGIAGLTERDAITATQAAIWHLTNPDETPSLDLAEGDQATKDRVGKLYDYLIGEKNGGLQEPTHPTIEVKGANDTFTLNDAKTEGRVGPIRFESNQPTTKLTSELKHDLVDKDGKAVDRNAIPTNTDLYLKVPADMTSGEQEFTASVTGTVQAGKLFITKSGKHGQTIITVSTDEIPADGQGKITWSTPQQSTPAPPPTTPTVQPSTPTVQPSTPTAQPTTPTAQPTTPTAQPTTPTAQPTQPTTTATSTVTISKSAEPPVIRKPGLPRTGD